MDDMSSARPTSGSGSSARPAGGSGSAGVSSGSSVRPVVAASGRRVAELVRGWTEAGEPQRQTETAVTGRPGGRSSTAGTEQTDQTEKVRRRRQPSTQSFICYPSVSFIGSFIHLSSMHISIQLSIHSFIHFSFIH